MSIAEQSTAIPTGAIPAGTWSLDPVHSDVGFAVSYSGAGTFRGGLKEIDGELTLRGVTKPVTISGTVVGPTPDAYGNQRLAFDVETTVDRREFGIDWNLELPNGVPALGNDVKITANLALVQA